METPTTQGAPSSASSSTSSSAPAATSSSAPASTAPVSAPATSAPATSAPATPTALPTTTAEANTDTRSTEEIIRERLTGAMSDEQSAAGDDDAVVVPDANADADLAAAVDQPQGDAPVIDDAAPQQLAELLAKNEAARAAIEADPELKGQLHEMARTAAEVNDYRTIVGSPDEARVIAANGTAFSGLSDGIAGIDLAAATKGDYSSFDKFLDGMVAQSVIRDENGHPVLDAQGQPVTDGSVGAMFKTFFMQRMDILKMGAQKSGNDQVLAALDMIEEFAQLRPGAKMDDDSMSEEMKAQKADLDRRTAEADAREATSRTQVETDYFSRVGSWSNTETDNAVAAAIKGATGLDADQQGTAGREIRRALDAALKKSQFKTELKPVNRMPFGPAREQRHKALATRYLNTYLGRVAGPVLARLGAVVKTKEEQRIERQTASSAEAQSEARGSLSSVQQKPAGTDNASSSQIAKDLAASLGREPSTFEIIQERGKRAFAKP